MCLHQMIVGTILLAMTGLAADFAGTWKLNSEKSKPADDVASDTMMAMMKIEQTGPNTYRSTIDSVQKSGQKSH